MTISLWALVLASVDLLALAQMLLKLGMTSAAVEAALSSAQPPLWTTALTIRVRLACLERNDVLRRKRTDVARSAVEDPFVARLSAGVDRL